MVTEVESEFLTRLQNKGSLSQNLEPQRSQRRKQSSTRSTVTTFISVSSVLSVFQDVRSKPVVPFLLRTQIPPPLELDRIQLAAVRIVQRKLPAAGLWPPECARNHRLSVQTPLRLRIHAHGFERH